MINFCIKLSPFSHFGEGKLQHWSAANTAIDGGQFSTFDQ